MNGRGEVAWKWMLRIGGLAIVGYVLVVQKGEASAGLLAIAAGMMGLPSVLWGGRR